MTNIITVDFHGDTLFATETESGPYVVPKPIADRLGLAWSSQYQRIKRDTILAEGMFVMNMPSPGGVQETVVLKLDLLPGWLFGISENAVKPELRDAVLTYKRECHAALYRRFFGGPTEARAETIDRPYIARAAALREEPINVRRQVVGESRQTFGHQVAREVWFAAGMIITPSMYADPAQSDLFSYTAIKKDEPGKGEPA